MKSTSLTKSRSAKEPQLTFAPLAWLKLQFFLHRGANEIGGFAITAPENPLHVLDFATVKQQVTAISVVFDDQALAEFFDRCVDRGLAPAQFARVWMHTHPCVSPEPSGTDEATFARVFGGCDWALMFIIGRTGQTYARLSFSAGPGGAVQLPVGVDWESWPARLGEQPTGLDAQVAAWQEEYVAHVQEVPLPITQLSTKSNDRPLSELEVAVESWWDVWPWDPELDGHHYDVMEEADVHELLRDLRGRDLRQRELVPPAGLAECHALVVGVGAIGRQVALQLAAMGVPRLTLIDDDSVSVENLAPQGYWAEDLNVHKVSATGAICRRLNPELQLSLVHERFRRSMTREALAGGNLIVACCVDSIATRRHIWESLRRRAALFLDGRMSAEVLRILASDHPASDNHYTTTLFGAEEAFAGSCTAKSTIYTASIAAGLMVGQLTRWLRGLPVEADVTLNLLAMELTVAPIQ